MSEHSEQALYFYYLGLFSPRYPLLEYIFAVPNGGFRARKTANLLKAEGVKAGVPDIIIPFPRMGYTSLAIEMKWGKNEQSPDQEKYQEILESEGWRYQVCRTAERALNQTGYYLGLENVRVKNGVVNLANLY